MYNTVDRNKVVIKEIVNVYEMLRKILKVASAHKTDPYTKFSKIIKLCNNCPIVHIDSLINESSIIDICNRIRKYLKISISEIKNSDNLLKNINNLLILADSLKLKSPEYFEVTNERITIKKIFKYKSIYIISLIFPMQALLKQQAHRIVSSSSFLTLQYKSDKILNVINDFYSLNISFNPMYEYYKGYQDKEIYTDINADSNLPLISKNSFYADNKLIDIKKIFTCETEKNIEKLPEDIRVSINNTFFINSIETMQTSIQAPTRMTPLNLNLVKKEIARNNYSTHKYSKVKFIYWNYPKSKKLGVIEDKLKDTLFKNKYHDYFTFYDDTDTLIISLPNYVIPNSVKNIKSQGINLNSKNFIDTVDSFLNMSKIF